MSLSVLTFPCLEDNYGFLFHDSEAGITALIDIPDAAPIIEQLEAKGWALTHILITHHHWDHIDGLPDLLTYLDTKGPRPAIYAGKADAHRLPADQIDHWLEGGDQFFIGPHACDVIDVPGHTIGHIAFYIPAARALFSADSLMAMGCGRLFEGTPAQAHETLQKLDALPEDTLIYCGHEYTVANINFALTVDPHNPALISRAKDAAELRANGDATVPSTLKLERQTNPYLRCGNGAIQDRLDMRGAALVDVFTEIRSRKDRF